MTKNFIFFIILSCYVVTVNSFPFTKYLTLILYTFANVNAYLSTNSMSGVATDGTSCLCYPKINRINNRKCDSIYGKCDADEQGFKDCGYSFEYIDQNKIETKIVDKFKAKKCNKFYTDLPVCINKGSSKCFYRKFKKCPSKCRKKKVKKPYQTCILECANNKSMKCENKYEAKCKDKLNKRIKNINRSGRRSNA